MGVGQLAVETRRETARSCQCSVYGAASVFVRVCMLVRSLSLMRRCGLVAAV